MLRNRKGGGAPMILIVAVMMTILLLTGLLILFALQQEEEVTPPVVPGEEPPPVVENVTEEEPEVPQTADEYYYESAIDSKNASLCGYIANESTRKQCYEGLAMESLDACRKTSNETLFGECIMHFATTFEDMALCELLNESLECKMAVNPCYELGGTELLICLAVSRNDSAECQGNSDCLFNYSMTTGEDHCGEIETAAVKYACLSVLGNTDRCYDLTSESQKDRCYYLYAISTDNGNLCHSIRYTSLYASDCFAMFAVRESDPTLCDVSELDFNDQWNCYINYSLMTKDVSGCSYIHELATTHLFQCYYRFALEYGDPSACDLIGDPRMTSTCYIGVIIDGVELDVTKCGDIINEEWRNKCYTESAKMYNDPSICDNIVNGDDQWICLNAYDLYVSQQED